MTGGTAAEPSGLRGTYLTCPEGRLHVYSAGDRGSPVLLLSGAGIDNALLSWRHLIPALSSRHRVLALDWPKQGRSRPWNGQATHERLLAAITQVLDHFDLPSAALAGLSQGGALALAYAVEHPSRVDRIVALAPAGILSFPPVVHQALWLVAKLPLLSRTLPSAMLRSRESVARFARRALFAGPVDDFDDVVDEIMAEVRVAGAGSSDWQNASIGPLRMRVDLRRHLGEITCPALLVQGDKDAGVNAARSRAAAALIPGGRFVLLDGVGHWSSRQVPDRVNALIGEFLGEGQATMDAGDPLG
ncbi:alpha/beta hydrolase [Nonomuraea sp. KC401]|uniref:alpha/beta fold hydrolase n=1 Tax=unclassified Nonomuraea TaxID=2593643 RepID=UPI0010FDAAFB|nr:alpha/beta hydrolase [Nonomuraea sp. KC401]NBE94547.1 alpha/beta fold hydrolase [Nonomuraea sp. K271]TLF76396.1 alpha/beta hydrolase [Nonomuraea sp. KC401]